MTYTELLAIKQTARASSPSLDLLYIYQSILNGAGTIRQDTKDFALQIAISRTKIHPDEAKAIISEYDKFHKSPFKKFNEWIKGVKLKLHYWVQFFSIRYLSTLDNDQNQIEVEGIRFLLCILEQDYCPKKHQFSSQHYAHVHEFFDPTKSIL